MRRINSEGKVRRNKMRKKLTALALSLAMTTGVFTGGMMEEVKAEESTEETTETSEFVIEDGVLKDYTGDDEEVIVPDGVTRIGNRAFEYNENVSSVMIPDSTTSIGRFAFTKCINLVTVNFSENVTRIETGAFSECEKLKKIEIPKSVMKIDEVSFRNCKSLKEIQLPKGLECIYIGAFEGCSGLEEINVPSKVVCIGLGAFRGCTGLKKINIPRTVEKIESDTFANCVSLSSVTIEHGVKEIDMTAFSGCESLVTLKVPASVYRMLPVSVYTTPIRQIIGYDNTIAQQYAEGSVDEFINLGEWIEPDVKFTILTDKEQYFVGDEMIVTVQAVNIGNRAVQMYDSVSHENNADCLQVAMNTYKDCLNDNYYGQIPRDVSYSGVFEPGEKLEKSYTFYTADEEYGYYNLDVGFYYTAEENGDGAWYYGKSESFFIKPSSYSAVRAVSFEVVTPEKECYAGGEVPITVRVENTGNAPLYFSKNCLEVVVTSGAVELIGQVNTTTGASVLLGGVLPPGKMTECQYIIDFRQQEAGEYTIEVKLNHTNGKTGEKEACFEPFTYEDSITIQPESERPVENNPNQGVTTPPGVSSEPVSPEQVTTTSIYIGDVNDDGKVALDDATKVLRYALLLEETENTRQRVLADANENGTVELADATKVLRMALLLEEWRLMQ